jgi:iron complex outermembrane receptor protein
MGVAMNEHPGFHTRSLTQLCGAVASLVPLGAIAQEVEQGVLQEVVVTAQKREQNLQDIGISVAALSADDLKSMGVTSVEQLGSSVPGVMIFQFGEEATTTITIRGVSQNDFADHNEAPVAVYQDGAYNSFIGGAGFTLFDVDRIEILRGPQGTLFGRNATGGLVQVISKKPTDKFEAYVSADAGQFGLAHAEGALSGPLSDTISSRLSLSATRQDGTVQNTIGRDKQGADNMSGRLQFDFHPSDDVSLLLNVRGLRDDVKGTVAYKTKRAMFSPGVANGLVRDATDFSQYQAFCQGFFGSTPPAGSSDCFGFTDPKPSDPWTVAQDTDGVMDRKQYGTTATLTWKINPDVQLTSISDYLKLDRLYVEDTDGTANKVFNFYSDMDSWQASEELRLNGSAAAGTFNWQAGLYYLKIEHDILTGADANTGFGLPTDFFTANRNKQSTRSYSAFGQVDWAFADQWNVTAGVRYVSDKKRMTIAASCSFAGCDTLGLTAPGIVQGIGFNESVAPGLTERSDGDVAAKVELDWRPISGLLTYASVNRGIKGGGFNAAAVSGIPISYVPYEPEVLTAYEVGVKSTFLDQRAQLNTSVFYYDYKNYQAFTLTGFSPFVFNTSATTQGAEVELRFLPARSVDVSVGISYLDAIAKDVPLQFPSGPFVDQRPPQSPEYTGSATVRKRWTLPSGTLALQGSVNYVDKRYFNTINHPGLSDDAYTVGNARLSYLAADERWEFALWANNITNEEYLLTAFDMSTSNGVVAQAYAPQRQIGATISYWVK